MKGYIITWAASVLSAGIIGAAWNYTHPAPRMVRVNLTDIVAEHTKQLESKIKTSTTDEEKQAVLQLATSYGKRLDGAIATLAHECRCAVLNDAAILRVSGDGEIGIPDMSWRVKDLLATGK